MWGYPQNDMHICGPCKTGMHSFKMIPGKLLEELRPQSLYSKRNLTWNKVSQK